MNFAKVRAADPTSPDGLWATIDDKTGKPRGLIRIFEQAGKFYGRIEKGFDPSPKLICSACKDDRKDQPMQGLVIMRGMVRHGDEYSGGDILNPDTGAIYHCSFQLEQGGTRLAVRGYVGISLFGRTQIWERDE